MSSGGSPYGRYPEDLESGGGSLQDYGSVCDPLDVASSSTAVGSLKRWRQAALVLKASRGFRYTLDLKKNEQNKEIAAKIGTHAQAIRVTAPFQSHGEKPDGTPEAPPSPIPTRYYNDSPEQVVSTAIDVDCSTWQNFDGGEAIVELLTINPDTGIDGDQSKTLDNTYPRKKGRRFWVQRKMTNIHTYPNRFTRRIGGNAHPRDWMFGGNLLKWAAFLGTYCTISGVLTSFISLRFSRMLSAYETHGWFIIASIVALVMTIFTSWIKFSKGNDLTKEDLSPMYNMILNRVLWFSALTSHLSLVLVIILPHKVNWVGYAVLCLLFVVIFVFNLIKVIRGRASTDKA